MLVVHSMWWQLQYGTLRDEIDRRRLERAAAQRQRRRRPRTSSSPSSTPATRTGTRLTIPPSRRCVQSACTDSARRAHAFLSGAAAFRRRGRTNRRRRPPRPAATTGRWPACTRAPGVALIANDMHLDLGVPAVWYPARLRVTGDPADRRHRRHAARNAGSRRGFQRPGGLGIHQQLWRFRRRALGQVREPRLSACVARPSR